MDTTSFSGAVSSAIKKSPNILEAVVDGLTVYIAYRAGKTTQSARLIFDEAGKCRSWNAVRFGSNHSNAPLLFAEMVEEALRK